MVRHQSYRDKLRETEFKKKMLNSLDTTRRQGVLQGSRAMLKVIGDKITEDNGMSAEEKLADVMKFINTSLALTDKTVKEAEINVTEARKPIEELGQDQEDVETIEVPDEAPAASVKKDQEDDDE